MFQLIEPTRWIIIVQNRHQSMLTNPTLNHRVPILADIFVFTYPIYLLGLYSRWWIKKIVAPKISALIIGVNVVITVLGNIGIQFLVSKQRPNIVLGFIDDKTETVLHKFLPSSSFPSDHAAVSMSIAIASLLRGITYKDKKYIGFGVLGVIFSIIMCGSRIATGVHRPTDIIWGMLVGIVIPSLLFIPQIHKPLKDIMTRIAQKI